MLKRVSIQNFKSLKDVTLDLQKVNLLIGPNNSGKTNFLKALEFAGNLNEQGNLIRTNQIFKKSNTVAISMHFAFDSEMPFDPKDTYVHYFIVPEKKPTFNREENYALALGRVDTNEFKIKLSSIDYGKTLPGTSIYSVQVKDIQYYFGPSMIYKPDPNKLTKPGPVGTGEEFIIADASNLVGFLDLMLGKYRRSVFNRTESDLSKCIPEFDEINLEDASPTDELKKLYGDKSFKRIGLTNSKQDVTYWADELSEGTLYFLALLCIINQPNPPKILLLEEPEKGIHPRRIWEVMKFIFQLAEEKDVQIIMTTHNEHVVNAFASMPESVFVFDKDEETGATSVRNLQRDIIEPANQKSEELGLDKIDFTSNLGEYWMYGLIGGVPANVE